MKGYKHLTEFDRNKIARMRKEGATMREIGAALHVSAATVCREIKRGTYTYMNADYIEVTEYIPERSQKRYEANLEAKGPGLKIGNHRDYAEKLEELIVDYDYSPSAALHEIENHPEIYGEFGVRVCRQTLYSYVENQIDDGSFDVDISKADCYKKPAITADMLEETCKKLNNLNDIEITFDFIYTTETLTGDTIMDWITFDEDNAEAGYTVDEDKAMAYVEDLADKYDTYGKDREFKTTKRGTITISEGQGCYGWWIDQQKTCDLIVDLVEKGESAETEPVYYVNPDSAYEYTCNKDWRTADKDYGNTYIEVDLTAQHLWYYKDGKLAMESDIVSGYPSKSRNTPGGVYKLWYKEKGKTLRGSADGQSYASYVDYWNNVSTIGIGLHDASWQNGNFGGERYKSSTWGSHGCINMPLDKAKYVYDKIDMGTPVFMYW